MLNQGVEQVKHVFSKTLPLFLDRASVNKDVRIFLLAPLLVFRIFSILAFSCSEADPVLFIFLNIFCKNYIEDQLHTNLLFFFPCLFSSCASISCIFLSSPRGSQVFTVYSPCTKLCSALVAASCPVYLLI